MTKQEVKDEIERVLGAILVDGNMFDAEVIQDVHISIGSPLAGEVMGSGSALAILSIYINDLIDNMNG